MVHDGVNKDPDAALVRLVNHLPELVLGAEVRIKLGEVRCPVAMVAVERPGLCLRSAAAVRIRVVHIAAADEAVGLLDNRGNPDGVDAKALDVVKLLGDSLEVSAVPGADLVLAVLVAPEGVVV